MGHPHFQLCWTSMRALLAGGWHLGGCERCCGTCAEGSDVGTAATVVRPLRVEAFALEFVGQGHSGHGVVDVGERRIVVGFVATDVIVMVERASNDSGEVPGTKHGVAGAQVVRYVDNY